jgi:DNA-cytosine methyltransferase
MPLRHRRRQQLAEVAGGVMSEQLLSLLCGAVRARSRDETVALLLSGGVDSTSVGIALQNAGRAIRAYTYRLQGYESKDFRKAIAIARHFGWHLTIITVPTVDAARDFVRLAVEHRCRKKTQFEVTFPLLYVLPRIAEAEVWTGCNADDHYGNRKNYLLHQKQMAREGSSPAERKKDFDAYRRACFERLANPDGGDTFWYAHRLAAQCGKRLLDPYIDETVREFFLRFDHKTLSPLNKPLVRQALADELRDLPKKGSLTVGVRLQTGGGVDALFETLLHDPAINRFEKKYTKVSPLCQRWGEEVERRPKQFLAELKALPSRSAPTVSSSDAARYRPYTMDDVHRASAARKFTAMSTFAGGGGSCIGFHLAGGHVVLASEFVPEARRTYAANFPDTPIDTRDIREVIADGASIKTFLARAGLKPGELDILNGSPPCCEFSTAGRGISDQQELRRYSDTKQRGMATLILDFFKLARHARPKIVVGENVPALAWSKNRAFFEGALDTLRYADPSHTGRLYYVNSAVLSASGFGVPQDRRRLFFIGVRADAARAVGIDDDDDVLALFPEPSDFPVSIRSALADLRQADAEIDPWCRAAMTGSIGRWIDHLPPNPRKRLKLKDVGFPADSLFSMVRCAWDLPAPTLTVTGQGPKGLSGAIHPEANRKFTIPELKRLFGLPDDYALTGTLAQAAERVCRMVPPRVTQAIAEQIYERVLRPLSDSLAREAA